MNDFNLIAPLYDRLAGLVFGKTLQNAQRTFLHTIPLNANILIVGGGTGEILIEILKNAPNSRITYQEASSRMIELTKEKLEQEFPNFTHKVNFVCKTDLQSLDKHCFHVVITPFVLDLFKEKELDGIFSSIHEAILPQSLWLWTDFCIPNNKFKWVAKGLISAMYVFFRLASNISASELPPISNYFEKYSYQLTHEAFFLKGMVQTRVYCKMNDNI